MIQSVNNELHKEDLTNVWKDLNSYVSTKFSIEVRTPLLQLNISSLYHILVYCGLQS